MHVVSEFPQPPRLKSQRAAQSPKTELAVRVERRRPTRLPVNLPLTVEHTAGRFQAVALNLGLGGVFIEANIQLAYGTEIVVLLQLPGTNEPTPLPGLVRWQRADGFGVQFLELGARATYTLSVFMAALR